MTQHTTGEPVFVLPPDPVPGQEPGQVPAAALPRWESRGWTQVNPDGTLLTPAEVADADLPDDETVVDPQTPVDAPEASTDGTAADDADIPTTDSAPKTTGRAGRGR